MTADRKTALAVAASLAVHGLIAVLAPDEPPRAAPPDAPEPRVAQLLSVRVIEPPAPPAPAQTPPPPKPLPPPPPPEPQKEMRPEPVVKPQPKKKKARAKKQRPRRKKARRVVKKRRPGRTLTAAKTASSDAPSTAIPSGDGDPIELGVWDPSASEVEVKAAPSAFEPVADDGEDDGPVAAFDAPPPAPLTPPVPLSRPSGRYPDDAPATLGVVEVALALRVGANGRVASARVVRGAGAAFDREAVRLARTIRFEPARRGARTVPMTIPWTVTFK